MKYSAAVSVAALMSVPIARAQNANSSSPTVATQGTEVEEVVVTSRRRAEKLQDVPLTVSAFSADQLESLAITDKITLADFTPGLSFSDLGYGRADRGDYHAIIFRGLNVATNYDQSAAALVFLDGAPVIAGDVLISDSLERIEVLKGPQNVYFGRSVMTGAINYVTRAPGNDYKGSISVEVGNYNEYKIDAHIEGPIVQNKLTFGLDGELQNKGGQYTSLAQPDVKLGATKTKSIAGTLYATPTDDLSIKLYANFYNYDDGPSASVSEDASLDTNSPNQPAPPWRNNSSTCNPGGPTGRVGGSPTGALIGNFYPCGNFGSVPGYLIDPVFEYSSLIAHQLNAPAGVPMLLGSYFCNHYGICDNTFQTHGLIKYELPDGIKIEELAAFHHRDVADMLPLSEKDTSGIPNPYYGNPAYPYALRYQDDIFNLDNRLSDYSTETRISSADDQSLRWTVGVNYVHSESQQELIFLTDTGNVAPYTPGQQFAANFTDTVGVFGGLYWQPIDELTISAELRWQDDSLTSAGTQATSPILSHSWYSRAPRVSIDYKVSPTLNVYTSASEGVRPGGFNGNLISLPQPLLNQIISQVGNAAVAFNQEKLITYELGAKGSVFDNAVRYNVSAYKGKLLDQQVSALALTTYDAALYGVSQTLTSNQGNVNIEGVEADSQWKVNRILELSGTFAWNHTEVLGTSCHVCYLVTGNLGADNGKSMTLSPQYSASLAADLRDSLTANLDWFAHADMSWKGKQWIDQENLSYIPANALFNMQAGVENETFSFGAWVTNLTNNKTILAGQIGTDDVSGSNNNIYAALANLRSYGLRFKYKFNGGSMEMETKAAAYVPPPVVAAAAPVAHSYQVFFDFNKSDLTPEAVKVVDQAAANAAPAKVTRIDVTGHTDTVGSDAYNMRLSRRRAESVAAELQARGIPSSEIAIFAKGKKDLLVPTADGVREPQNRRVQIVYEGGPTS
jgi:iron complex outermembrane receptor protein